MATQRGVLFVASAGNDGVNTDLQPHYPSSLPDNIVLAVAATTRKNTIWYASAYRVTAQGCCSRSSLPVPAMELQQAALSPHSGGETSHSQPGSQSVLTEKLSRAVM